MNSNKLSGDHCSYVEKLNRSIAPGLYSLNVPYNDCNNDLPNDPFYRFQNYGPNTCTMKNAVDDSSELLGLNYKNSKCSMDNYTPDKYKQTGCFPKLNSELRSNDYKPVENTRLSNPPHTLKETGINRFNFLFFDPQEKVIEKFDHIPVNVKNLYKDNHIPLIEKVEDQIKFYPNKDDSYINNNLDKWVEENKNNILFKPGYPYDNFTNYNIKCQTNIKSF